MNCSPRCRGDPQKSLRFSGLSEKRLAGDVSANLNVTGGLDAHVTAQEAAILASALVNSQISRCMEELKATAALVAHEHVQRWLRQPGDAGRGASRLASHSETQSPSGIATDDGVQKDTRDCSSAFATKGDEVNSVFKPVVSAEVAVRPVIRETPLNGVDTASAVQSPSSNAGCSRRHYDARLPAGPPRQATGGAEGVPERPFEGNEAKKGCLLDRLHRNADKIPSGDGDRSSGLCVDDLNLPVDTDLDENYTGEKDLWVGLQVGLETQ